MTFRDRAYFLRIFTDLIQFKEMDKYHTDCDTEMLESATSPSTEGFESSMSIQSSTEMFETMKDNVKSKSPTSGLCAGTDLGVIDAQTTHETNESFLCPQPATRILPMEIWENVMIYAEFGDLKSLRLVCKDFDQEGKRHLFGSTFVFRRDRLDIERYWELMKNEDIASRTTRLIFESGVPAFGAIVDNFSYGQEGRRDRALSNSHSVILTDLEDEKTRFIYDCARMAFDIWRYRQYFGYSRSMSTVFSGKPTLVGTTTLGCITELDRIDVTIRSTPVSFSSMRAWYGGSGNSLFRCLSEEFRQILTLIAESPHRPKHLSHDNIPVTFFTYQINTLESFVEPLRYLQTLHLTFDATKPPIVEFWKGLKTFLTSASQLRNLRFGFDLVEPKYVRNDNGYWFCRCTDGTVLNAPEAWYAPLWKIFGAHKWQYLTKLRLDGMVFCQEGLSSLFYRHSRTLRVLELDSIGLWNGSFHDLLSGVRDHLSLTDFNISGHCEAFHASDECWNFPHIYDPFEDVWCRDVVEFTSWQMPQIGFEKCPDHNLGRKMKEFILGGEPWPIKRIHTVESCTEFRLNKLHGPGCADDCMDRTRAKNRRWDDDSEDDRLKWENPPPSLCFNCGTNEFARYTMDPNAVDDPRDEPFRGATTFSLVRKDIREEVVRQIMKMRKGGPMDRDEDPVVRSRLAVECEGILIALWDLRMTDPKLKKRGTDCL